MSADMVKVKVASVCSNADGAEGTRLLLTTVDGLEISFDLDDLAVSLLAFTVGFKVKELKEAQLTGKTPVIHKGSVDQ